MRADLKSLSASVGVAALLCAECAVFTLAPSPVYAAGIGGSGFLSNGGDGSSGSTAATPGQGGTGGPAGSDPAPITADQTISATITGNSGGSAGGGGVGGGGGGGVGALVGTAGVTIANQSTIGGGSGGGGSVGSLGPGGGGGGGGDGVAFTQGGILNNNSGTITGGSGGSGGGSVRAGGGGGGGGDGVAFMQGGTLNNNSGTITGGTGGSGTNSEEVVAPGGLGGNAVVFTQGGTLNNSGTITGGSGGSGGSGFGVAGISGLGGVGIIGDTLTIVNAGTISGGFAGSGGPQANAITFTGGTNSLELQAGYVVNGNVVGLNGSTNTLILGGSTNASFDLSKIAPAGSTVAQYQGFSSLQKTGVSAWTLTGTMTATTPWTVSGGTLVVDGSIASSSLTTVNSNAVLSGSGTVGTTVVNAGGFLAPGPVGAPGNLTIVGSLAFQSGAFYVVQLTASTASSANVSGTATLTGGSVQTVFAPGSYITRQYTILHAAGGLSGTTFAGISGSVPAGFTQRLSYTSTDVLLDLTGTLGALPGAGSSGNQQSVAGALNNFFNSGGTLPPSFVGIFGLTGTSLGTALSQLSGEAATGAQQGAFQFMGQFLSLMLDPFVGGRGGAGGPALGFGPERDTWPEDIALAYAKAMKAPAYKAPPPTEPRWSVWASGFGGASTTNGDAASGSHDLTAHVAGGAAGLDYRLTRDVVIGFALAGGGTNWALAQGLGGGKSDAFQGGVYAAARSGPAYVAASLAAANHWISTDRFAAFGDHLSGSFDGQSYGGRIEGGYRFATAVAGVTPYAALQVQSFRTPFYSETDLTGGGFALSYNARSATDTRGELGARFDRAMLAAPDAVLTLRGRLAWAHDWVSDPSLAAVFQALPGASFIVNGATPAKDNALVSVGADLHVARGWTLAAKFDGEFAARSQTFAGSGTMRYNW